MRFVALSFFAVLLALPFAAEGQQSVARQWDEEILAAIRIDLPRPPVHARNLFHVSVAMYDAWAAYETNGARGYLFTEKIITTNAAAERDEAISYAAFRVLMKRYSLSVNSNLSLAAFSNRMATLGYDPSVTNTIGNAPSAVGNRIAAAIIAYGLADGANEQNNYRRTNGYAPVNEPLIVAVDQIAMADPNRWQPLALAYSLSQNGIPEPVGPQVAVCPHWGYVKPFAMLRRDTNDVYEDRGPPPQLGTATDEQFKQEMFRVLELSSWLTPDDGVEIDISPGAFGNNSLGYNDGAGYASNPVTGQPYATNVVLRGDFGRVIAEYWADGPNSETPPGHWNVLANKVSDNTGTVKKIGGVGPVVSNLEWDVKLYFGLNGAVHDAAIAAWNHKGVYDSVRPISGIRYMGSLGQSSDPLQPSYNTNGLPLVPGLVEIIPTNTVLFPTNIGEIMLHTWPGQPADPTNQHSGAQWTRSRLWLPYQKNTFVTPAFPGLISGHSSFSRSAADYLTHFTGSPYFPGGFEEFVAHSNTFLTFERGPDRDVRLQWATYYDAADQAGQSRLWGGIHIASDDREGRKAGAIIGDEAWQFASQFFAGASQPHPPYEVDMNISPGGVVCSWPAVSGRTYRFQVSTNLVDYADVPGVYTAATWNIYLTNAAPASTMQVFRVITGN